MAVTIRTPSDILSTMLDVVSAQIHNVDRNVGSVIRTLLEASALLDAEQYVQIVKAIDSFYIDTASGEDLYRRVKEFGITDAPLPAKAYSCEVLFGDSAVTSVVSSEIAVTTNVGGTSITVTNGASWPASGTVVLSPGTAIEERCTYTRSSDVLTISAAVNQHAAPYTAVLSQQSSNRVIPAGTVVVAPATAVSPEIAYATDEDALILDGYSNAIKAVSATARETGTSAFVMANKLTDFQSPPFQTAFIASSTQSHDGRDAETDAELRSRTKAWILALPRGTASALANGVVGVTDGTVKITSAQVIEESMAGLITMYVDDGSSGGISLSDLLTAGTVDGYEVLTGPSFTKAGDKRMKLQHAPLRQTSDLRLYMSPSGDGYKGVCTVLANVVTKTSGSAIPAGTYSSWAMIDSSNKLWPITSASGTTITLGTSATPSAGPFCILGPIGTPLTIDANWKVNLTTGDIEYTPGLEDYDAVVAYDDGDPANHHAYQYYGGIFEELAKVINGVPSDLTNYPGIKALGQQVTVTVPSISSVNFTLSVVTAPGYSLSDVKTQVENAVAQYVNYLPIAGTVYLAQIVARVMVIPGIMNVAITTPASDVGVSDGGIAKVGTITVS